MNPDTARTVVFLAKVFGPAVLFGICLWWVTSR